MSYGNKKLIFFIIFFSSFTLFGQKCEPNTTIRTVYCPNWTDSASVCFKCFHCKMGLAASDNSLTVISFKIIFKDFENGDITVEEASCIGNTFSAKAMRLLVSAKKSDSIIFTCVKAKNKKEEILILQPLAIELNE